MRMNEESFKTLYSYAKRVYSNEMSLEDASAEVHSMHPEVAESSARHYITWYSKMHTGEYLTWNTNSELLKYYCKRIKEEEGNEAGLLAIKSAMKFAKHVSRNELIDDLQQIAGDYSIDSSDQNEQQKSYFSVWLESIGKYKKSTIRRYIVALEKSEERLGIKLSTPIFSVSKISGFKQIETEIKSAEKYEDVNKNFGNGDLSAALSAYGRYLNRWDDNWWPSVTEYTPGFSVEDWIDLLKDSSIFKDNHLAIMKRMKDIGGSASCTQLAEKYGESKNFYNSGSSTLAENIAKKTGCSTDWKDKISARWWPILYQGREAEKNEIGGYIYRLRDELSEALDKVDLSNIPLYAPKKEEATMTDKQKIERIKKYIAWKGFSYEEGLIENFYLSLKSKPFVILAGTSGTGKTRLVKLFAEAISAEYKMMPVRPDWSDSSDLFGHVNLNGEFVPGAILEFISEADKQREKPFILCLDEMNLARVEYYLSDFLSVIETRELNNGVIESAPLISLEKYGSDLAARKKYGELGFPENLYIVGTVNMDETTFPFSKKVLDRANTIEFSYVDLMRDNSVIEDENPLNVDNEFLVSKYLFLAQCQDNLVDDICSRLQEINEVLRTANAHVGYRVRDEIVFYMINNKKAGLLSDNEALDNEIMQKILPRIQGSTASVKTMLCELFNIFAGDYDGYQTQSDDTASKMLRKLQEGPAIYPHSAEKVAFMVRRFEEDGFTSYWL